MTSKLSQELGEQVTCAICLEHYSDPRLLPCLHTYCKQCLQDLLAKGKSKESVVCPECREQVQITSGDVTKLKVNFWINNLLSLLVIHSTQEKHGGKTELTCENCDSKEPAKGRCVNCCMFLCNFCSTAHQRFLATKGHHLMTLDELKETGIPVLETQSFCEKHKGEVRKLFCNTCQGLICRDCTILDHRDHEFSFTEDVADQHKESLKTEIRRASDTRNKVETVLKSVQEMKEKVEKTSKATEKDIDDFIDNQMKALEERRARLKEETRRIAATKMKDLAAQEDGLVMHLAGLQSAIEFTEKILNSGGNSDVLSISKQVTSRLSQLSEKSFPSNPCKDAKIGLKADEQAFSDCIQHRVEVIDACIPDPSQCSIARLIGDQLVQVQDSIQLQENEALEFVVCIRNSLGDKLKFMADRIEIKLSNARSRSRRFSRKYNETSSFSSRCARANRIRDFSQGFEISSRDGDTYSFTARCVRSNKIIDISQGCEIFPREDDTYGFSIRFTCPPPKEIRVYVLIDGRSIQNVMVKLLSFSATNIFGRAHGRGLLFKQRYFPEYVKEEEDEEYVEDW